MDSKYKIQSKYIEKSSKTTVAEEKEEKEAIKVETEKYGTGKPKRTIIRAKITHGKD